MENKSCEWCGGTFARPEGMHQRNWGVMRYCGPKCRHAASNHRKHPNMTQAQRMEQWRLEREEFVRDVQLLMTSTYPEDMCRRMGMSLNVMLPKLRRMGRGDLADQLLEEVERYGVPRGFRSSSSHRA